MISPILVPVLVPVSTQSYLFLFCVFQFLAISVRGEFWDPVTNLTKNIVSCSICDSLDLPLRGDVRPLGPYGNATCSELSIYFSKPENRVSCTASFLDLRNKCCDRSNSTHLKDYDCDQKIREQFFSRNHLITVPPYEDMVNRIKIQVGLTYGMVQDLNVKESTADIIVTVELKWHDPRLAWNITPSMCLPFLPDVRASESMEESEIWVPNFNLLNRIEGTEGFAPTRAYVLHDGTVSWRQFGKLKAACSYRGLGMIPFDTLGCQLVFGNPVNQYAYELVATESIRDANFTQRYKDFEIDFDRTHISYLTYFGVPRSGILYDLYFKRAHQFYQTKIIVPTIVFTYASFGMFLLSMNSGERLGYGISVVLVIVAQGIIIKDYIPLCKESLWLDTFIEVSTYFTYVCLFESIIMSWLFDLHQRYQQHKKSDKDEDEDKQNNDTSSAPLEAEEGDFKEDPSVLQENPSNKTGILRKIHKPFVQFSRNMEKVEDTKRYVKRVDSFCLIFIPLAYTIFIIIMYSNKINWDDEGDYWIVGDPVGQEL